MSSVAKSSGLFKKRRFFIGIQAVVKKNNNNIIDFYPLKQGFGWTVPENRGTLKVGVASINNPKQLFEQLIKKYKGKIITKQGGLIPIFNPRASFNKSNVFLVGDAAGFVKATTGGGLVSGLKSAEILANSIKNKSNYITDIYLKLFPSLWLNLKMRKMIDSFIKEDWNELIKDLNNPSSKKALQSINRDKIFSLLFKLSINNPEIIKKGIKHLNSLF